MQAQKQILAIWEMWGASRDCLCLMLVMWVSIQDSKLGYLRTTKSFDFVLRIPEPQMRDSRNYTATHVVYISRTPQIYNTSYYDLFSKIMI
jgi:hypothetical protein